jgi:hypothetical protein
MTKRAHEKVVKEMYLLLVSEKPPDKTVQALCAPILKRGNAAQFLLTVPFIPRFCGYFGTKAPIKSDLIRIYFVTKSATNEYSSRKKMGEYDFSTVDLEEILPSQEMAKLKNPAEKDSSESAKEEVDDDEDEDSEDESPSKSSSVDDPKDADYCEMSVTERIAACTEDTIYWQPEQSLWEFKFAVVRDPPHLVLTQVNFSIVKKKKS